MKIAAVLWLVLLGAVTSRARQPFAVDPNEPLPSLIPLFISCDLMTQFVAPAIDERVLQWLETPISREGARALENARRARPVKPVPLVAKADFAPRIESAPVARATAPEPRRCTTRTR